MTDPAPVADPHAPITNVDTAPVVHERLLSPPSRGAVDEVPPPAGGVEALAEGVRLESAVVATAPDVALPDIGSASFADPGLHLESVLGVDERIKVQDTHLYPWSASASLLITARDGSQWIGTGWFVSPRTLVTAAHCVYITGSGLPGRDGWVRTMQVMPGRNGTTLPFGSVTASQFWTVQGWADSGDENVDYGAIVIPTPLGDTVGTFGFEVASDGELAGSTVNVAGYPGDKPTGTMWFDTREVAATNPSKVHYAMDTAGGQSGAAVYRIEDGARIAVAVHAYGGATTNSGTRISPPVFRNLSDWKA